MSPRRAQVSARTAVQIEPLVLERLDDLARVQKKSRAMVVREIVELSIDRYSQNVHEQLARRHAPEAVAV